MADDQPPDDDVTRITANREEAERIAEAMLRRRSAPHVSVNGIDLSAYVKDITFPPLLSDDTPFGAPLETIGRVREAVTITGIWDDGKIECRNCGARFAPGPEGTPTITHEPSWLPRGFEFLSGLPEAARKRRFLMPIQVFADESGGKGQGRHFVMAGLISEAESWAAFADEWAACLRERHPRFERPIRIFKMKDAAGCVGEFRGWTEPERDAKLVQLARIINRHARCVTVSVIDLDAHARLLAPNVGKPMNEPYFWPFQNTMLAAAFTLQEKGWDERFEMIFDENVIFGPRAKMWYPVVRETIRIQQPEAYSILPVDPMFRPDDEFLPLQACDLFAWCFRAGSDIGADAPERPFEWLLPEMSNVNRSEHSQYYDEERLTSVMALTRQQQVEMAEGQHQDLFDALSAKYREIWGDDYRRRS